MLVRELQHRLRNLLGLVNILAERTATDCADIDDFLSIFQARLTALGRVQAYLSQDSAPDRQRLDDVLRAEIGAIAGIDPAEDHPFLQIDGVVDVMLDAEMVQILTLAVHELATNSVKHGVLGTSVGDLSLRWSSEHDTSGDWVTLEWRERNMIDRPVTDTPGTGSSGGFGRELIEKALPLQFGARTRYIAIGDLIQCIIELPTGKTPSPSSGSAP